MSRSSWQSVRSQSDREPGVLRGSTLRTAVESATEKLRAQAAEIGTALSDAAIQAREWTAPRVESFIEWLTPRLEKAYADSLRAAAPRVAKAAGKAGPVIDIAHDKLVEELIPRLVTAFREAAVRASAVAGDAAETVHDHAEVVAEVATQVAAGAETKKSHRAAKTFFVIATIAAAGAAGAAWYRSRTTVDPWAEPWEPTDPTGADSLQTRPHDGRAFSDTLNDAAGAVGEAAGTAVAKSREAAGTAVTKSREASRKAQEKAGEVKDAAESKVAGVKEAAENKVAEVKDAAVEKALGVKDAVEGTARKVARRAPAKAADAAPVAEAAAAEAPAGEAPAGEAPAAETAVVETAVVETAEATSDAAPASQEPEAPQA
ncbi:MAG: hypothetical protein FWF28_00030 [Micrococcales bacterium]|nr:hypothetical protein [Micrococcales bacterium]